MGSSTEGRMRFGIVGCANIATGAVIPGILASEKGMVAAVASRGIAKAEETAARFHIPQAYGSYEELLADPDIDAVYIPLPNHLHREWTIRAAEAGKHVLCEKPLALNAEEAQEMVDACARNGVHLAEAFMYRHHPRYARIAEIIASGEIGELRLIRGGFTFCSPTNDGNVRFKRELGGGSLYDVGCYPISAARLLFGREPEAVTVHGFFSPGHDHVDMMAAGLLEFEGGAASTIDCGMWANFRNVLEILGTQGRIEIPSAFTSGDSQNPGPSAAFTVITDAAGARQEAVGEGLNAYSLQADAFVDAVRGTKPARFPAQDAVSNMRVLDACLRSARERIRVELTSH